MNIFRLVAILNSRGTSAPSHCFQWVVLGEHEEEIPDTTYPSHFVGVVVN